MRSLPLSRLFTLLLVIAVGLITGYSVAKFTHAASASTSSATTVVNIQLAALVWSHATLATGLWLLRGRIARQWSWFTAKLELALDGLFDFESADEPLGRRISIQNSTVKGDVVVGRLLYRVPGSTLVEMYEPTPRQETIVGQAQGEWCAYCSGSHSDNAVREACRSQILKGVLPQPGTPEYEACAQGALDDAAKTTCTACGKLGHWRPDCPDWIQRPPPSTSSSNDC